MIFIIIAHASFFVFIFMPHAQAEEVDEKNAAATAHAPPRARQNFQSLAKAALEVTSEMMEVPPHNEYRNHTMGESVAIIYLFCLFHQLYCTDLISTEPNAPDITVHIRKDATLLELKMKIMSQLPLHIARELTSDQCRLRR